MKIEAHFKKSFNGFELDAKFSIPSKGLSILFGPSGTGKSTLLNCIAGTEMADFAILKIKNRLLDNTETKLRTPPHQRHIGYVFQDKNLFPHLNVLQNLEYPIKRNTEQSVKFILDEIVCAFKLNHLLQQMPKSLSGGQQQRVALARALLSQPELLILDEPLSALDFSAKQELIPYLSYIHNELNIPIIYVSHDLREIFQLGETILIMDNGKIIDQGNLLDLCLSQPLLTQQEGSSFILQGNIKNIDEQLCTSEIDINGQTFILTGTQWKPSQSVRVLIHASDVSLSLSKAEDSSILNILKTTIVDMQKTSDGKYLIKLTFNKKTILSMISYHSLKKLNLQCGMEIYAQIKATAIIR